MTLKYAKDTALNIVTVEGGSSSNSTGSGGDSRDEDGFISNSTNNTVINGTDGNDSIRNSNVSNVTINAGDGEDYIGDYGIDASPLLLLGDSNYHINR